jgi:hypothetical protein
MNTEGVGEDVRLSVTTSAGPVLDATLVRLALLARCAPNGELLPFTYREPLDDEAPDEPRPLRRAVLAIIMDEPVPPPRVVPMGPPFPGFPVTSNGSDR